MLPTSRPQRQLELGSDHAPVRTQPVQPAERVPLLRCVLARPRQSLLLDLGGLALFVLLAHQAAGLLHAA